MKKRCSIFFFLIITIQYLIAQLYDKNWVMGWGGYLSKPGYILTFNQSQIDQKIVNTKMKMSLTNLSMSNEKGELQFFSNGQKVLNYNSLLIENGYNLLENNTFINQNNDDYSKDYPFTAAFECFPDTKNKGLYFIYQDFYELLDLPINSESDTIYAATKLTLTKIDMNENGGLGKVIYKNKKIYDCQNFYKKVTVQHANGQYWWSILNHINGKDYSILLHNNDSLLSVKKITIDYSKKTLHSQAETQKCISQDGSVYLDLRGKDEIRIFDFDRCSGNLILKRKIQFIDDIVNNKSYSWGSISIAISPNNRFIYLGRNVLDSVNDDEFYTYLIQLDLLETDPWKSRIVLADNFYQIEEGSGIKFPTFIWHFQHGIDGKLYFVTSGENGQLYVIKNPNEKGKESGFCDSCNILPSNNHFSIPNFPNYRLGPLKGSPCDTILGVDNKDIKPEDYGIKLFPNPSSTIIKIDITIPQYDPTIKTEVVVVDVSGAIVMRYVMPDFAYIAELDISKLPSGVYGVQLRQPQMSGTRVLATEKLVVIE